MRIKIIMHDLPCEIILEDLEVGRWIAEFVLHSRSATRIVEPMNLPQLSKVHYMIETGLYDKKTIKLESRTGFSAIVTLKQPVGLGEVQFRVPGETILFFITALRELEIYNWKFKGIDRNRG